MLWLTDCSCLCLSQARSQLHHPSTPRAFSRLEARWTFHLKMARRRTGQRSAPAACFKANGGPEGAAGLILTRVAGSVPRGAGFRLGLELFLVCTTFLCGACHASRPALCPLRSQLAVAGRAMRLRGGRGWQKQKKSGGGQQPRLAAADNAEGDGGGGGGHAQSATAGQRAGRVKLGYSAQDFDRAALVQQGVAGTRA